MFRDLISITRVRYFEFLIVWLKRRRMDLVQQNMALRERRLELLDKIKSKEPFPFTPCVAPKPIMCMAVQVNGQTLSLIQHVDELALLNGQVVKLVVIPGKVINILTK